LFRAVIPLRYATTEVISPEMPVPLGLAIGTQGAGNILKMGGVCERWSHRYNYGLQILLFP
jgi:hypothetical protein